MPENRIRLFSWNVNGLRACGRKGFLDWLHEARPDVLGLQEVRALPEQLDEPLREPEGYAAHFFPAERKGYSGVGLFTSVEPESVTLGGLDEERFDSEGRLIIADYGDFLFYTGYFPNGGHDLKRVPYKLDFSEAVLQHAEAQRKQGKSIIICGDVNTAQFDPWALLRFNAQLTYGRIAVRGSEVLALHAVHDANAQLAEVGKSLYWVARAADEVEQGVYGSDQL